MQIPGPLLRIPEGTEVHASVHNRLSTIATVHGLHERPGDPDAGIRVEPGETREAVFKAGVPGSYYYWATTTEKPLGAREGIETQLSGAFIVDPSTGPLPGRIFVIGLWYQMPDSSHPFHQVLVINGKSWPYNEVLNYGLHSNIRWVWLNTSGSPHPMHLHGNFFRVDSVGDGEKDITYDPADRRTVFTELMTPGSTMSLDWTPAMPGRWIFHCHILSHISSDLLLSPIGNPNSISGDHTGQMAGLVLGIRVAPSPTEIAPPDPNLPVRQLRLFVRNRPAKDGLSAGYAYQLQDGQSEPSPDAATVPGSPLVLTRGQPVEITVVNESDEPTTVHWHGIQVPSYYDGVPGFGGIGTLITPAIAPGTSFVARYTPPHAGTFFYHTHWHDVLQLTGGLYGSLVVMPPEQTFDPAIDKVFVIGRGGPDLVMDPLLVNGSANPPALSLKSGITYRFRFINITPDESETNVTLLAGGSPVNWRPIAKDANELSSASQVPRPASQTVAVGETYDFEFQPLELGDLALKVTSIKNTVVTPIQVR